MRYNIIIDCPDDDELIQKILDVASEAGAGGIGKYTRCASISKVIGTWRTEAGAHPHIGKVGKISVVNSVKIEMQCPAEKVKPVCEAIKKVHPYEEPMIEVVKLEEV